MKKLLIFILILVSNYVHSQRNFALYNQRTMAQNHYYNPAFGSTYKFSLSVPLGMQNIGFSNSGFALQDILTKRDDDSLVIDPSKAIDKLGKINHIETRFESELFGLGMKIGKNYISISAIAQVNFGLNYPRDFYVFALEGNGGELLGRRADMDGLGVNLNAYMEYALGFNRAITEKLRIGARAKFISGVMNVTTRSSQLGLTTNGENYALTIDGALDVRTSGIVPLLKGDFNPVKNIFSFTNPGFAMDLGANFKLSEKLSFNGAINDLGWITWKEGVKNFEKKSVSYTFDGFDLRRASNDTSYANTLRDTLAEVFRVEENEEQYSQALPVRIVLGTQFQVIKNVSLFTTVFNDFQSKKYKPSAVVGATFNFRNWFSVSTNYMATKGSYGNIGLSLFLRGLGTQFFVSTDNILAPMNFAAHKVFHVSTGISLTVGRPNRKGKDKA